MKLTRPQRDLLAVLANVRPGLNYTARDLLPHLYEHHATPQGVTVTAASLVRRGLLRKDRDIDGHVCYRITQQGREAVQ